jgi:hypothetical protein
MMKPEVNPAQNDRSVPGAIAPRERHPLNIP